MVLSIGEGAGNVALGAEDSEEETEVLNVRLLNGVKEDQKTGSTDHSLETENLPSDAVFIGNASHNQRSDDSEEIRWRSEELCLGVVETESLLQNDAFEVGEGVDRGGGDEVLETVDDEFPVPHHLEGHFDGWMGIDFLGFVDADTAYGNMTLALVEPFCLFWEVGEEEDCGYANEDGYGAFDDLWAMLEVVP